VSNTLASGLVARVLSGLTSAGVLGQIVLGVADKGLKIHAHLSKLSPEIQLAVVFQLFIRDAARGSFLLGTSHTRPLEEPKG
jgi:hypothetical protein